MEYGWKEVPELYFTLTDGTLIGTNNYYRYFEETYATYEKPWTIKIISDISDFDLIDTLLSTNFNIYTKTIVQRRADGTNKVIWHKYSNAEISDMERHVSENDVYAIFVENFIAAEREQLHENNVPEEIKKLKK